MRYLDPHPLPAMRAELERGTADSTDVTSASPRWKHREIFRRAAAFRREFGYDFTQWQSPNGDDDPGAVGKLFCDGFGRIIAACAFRLREHEDQAWHALQWIWVAPPYRRAGVISAAWPSLRDRFGAFHVEGPVSEAMEAFLIKLGDEHLMDWNKVKRFRLRSAYPAD